MNRSFILLSLILTSAHARAEWTRHVIDGDSKGADGVRLMDVNEDGLKDIAVGWEEGALVRVYICPEKAKRRDPWPAITVGAVESPEDAVFVDINRDGLMDVLSSCEGTQRTAFAHIAPTNPDAYVNEAQWRTIPIPSTLDARQWMFALPLESPGSKVEILMGSKGANADVGLLQIPSAEPELEGATYESITPVGWIMSLAAADIDRDVFLDVIVSDRKGPQSGILWLESKRQNGASASSGPWSARHIGLRGKEVMFLDVADLDKDGRPNIIVPTKPNEIWVLTPDEDGQPWSERLLFRYPEMAGSAKAVRSVDLNRDGVLDLVATCESANGPASGVWAWIRKGHSIQAAADVVDISGPDGVKFDRIEVLDIDQDGDPDVLTCEERDNLGVIWYENPGF